MSRSQGWRLVVLLAVAAALTFVVKVADIQQDARQSGAAAALRSTIETLFAERACIQVADAERELRAALVGSEFAGWTVVRGGGAGPEACAAAGLSVSERRIVLIPTTRREVQQAMARVREELLRRCLGKDDAVSLVRKTLEELGETSPQIQTDGPIIIPVVGEAEAQRHVDAGCYVYSGVSWSAAGDPVFSIGGK